jgi:hypothetical protein
VRLDGHGIHIVLPRRWEGHIYARGGEATLHAANFPLPHHDADYATKALSRMGDHGALLVVTEFDPASAGRGLFAHRRPRRLHRADFSPRAMQRMVENRVGIQRFFTDSGRAFCLYAVIAAGRGSRHRVGQVNEAIDSLRIVARKR